VGDRRGKVEGTLGWRGAKYITHIYVYIWKYIAIWISTYI
jgi:hypothetical protein